MTREQTKTVDHPMLTHGAYDHIFTSAANKYLPRVDCDCSKHNAPGVSVRSNSDIACRGARADAVYAGDLGGDERRYPGGGRPV